MFNFMRRSLIHKRYSSTYSSKSALNKFTAVIISWTYGLLVLVFGFSIFVTNPLAGVAVILFAAISTPMVNLLLLNF